MTGRARRALRLIALVPLAALPAACYDFHLEGPEDPAPEPLAKLVSVTVVYTQPPGCISRSVPCEAPVLFLGTWMPPGQVVTLTPDPRHFVWTATVRDVPVNFPPRGAPYEVRIFDPHLQDDDLIRYTARRLEIGGQLLTRIQLPGAHDEHALVYVDDSGQGRNPF